MSDINVGIQCRLYFSRSFPVMTASTPGIASRFRDVDVFDRRVRIRTAHDVEIEHAGQVHVVDVITLAAKEARIFFAFDGVAHATDFGRCFWRHLMHLPRASSAQRIDMPSRY